MSLVSLLFYIELVDSLILPISKKFVQEIRVTPIVRVVMYVAESLAGVFMLHESTLLLSDYTPSLLQVFSEFLAATSDVEVSNRILTFYGYIVTSEQHKLIIDSWLGDIMSSVLQTITTDILTKALILIGGIFERNPDKAKAGLVIGFRQKKFVEVPETLKTLVVNYIVKYNSFFPKVKSILNEMSKYLRKLSNIESFIIFENEMWISQRRSRVLRR